MATAFIAAAGVYAVLQTPLDAIPDLSDPQVIVTQNTRARRRRSSRPDNLSAHDRFVGRAALEGGARFSFFGASFVYVVFEDAPISTGRAVACWNISTSPRNVSGGRDPSLGPDATGVGWVFEYAVMAPSRRSPTADSSRLFIAIS